MAVRPSLLPLLFVLVLAAGAIASTWLVDWRPVVTAAAVDLVVAFVGGRSR